MQNYAKISGFCRSLRSRRACGIVFFIEISPVCRPRARTRILCIREKADFVRFYTVRLYAAIT